MSKSGENSPSILIIPDKYTKSQPKLTKTLYFVEFCGQYGDNINSEINIRIMQI
jgi:hypothetical protein